MKKLACLAGLAAGALMLPAAEMMILENFERTPWTVDGSWRGKTVLSEEKPRSGKKAMLLTSDRGLGKCGNSRSDYLLGKYEYSLWASGSGELQLGVIRYDRVDGKLKFREDKLKDPVKLDGNYQKVVFRFEIENRGDDACNIY